MRNRVALGVFRHRHDHDGHEGTAPGRHAAHVEEPFDRDELAEGCGRGKTLFLDAQSGLAGDMVCAALVDLGVPRRVLEVAVASLGIEGVHLHFENRFAGAIAATGMHVHCDAPQPERSYREIRGLLDGSGLSAAVKRSANAIFRRLAQAEATVHRSPLDDVHFHEVGAVDSIADIVCAAAAFDYLGARVLCPPLPLGRGTTQCRHGVIPLPAPATVLCLQGLPTFDSGLAMELVTPTGAAIVGTLAEPVPGWPSFSPEGVGWGAGTREIPDRINALRAVLGVESVGSAPEGRLVLIECNVDDMSGEQAGLALERLLAAGAVDAWLAPVTMKKGRPGWVVSALCDQPRQAGVERILLSETTSIGLRRHAVERTTLPRHESRVQTSYGPIRVKVSGAVRDSTWRAKPEFEDCRRAAAEHGVTVRQVVAEASAKALELTPPEVP